MNSSLKKIVAAILVVLGVVMVYIGGFHGELILPPIITGIGFFLIAAVFWKNDKSQ